MISFNSIKKENRWLPYILLAPGMCAITVLLLYPIGRSISLSFHYMNLTQPGRGTPFVGLQNFTSMMSDPRFWSSFKVTLIYTFGMAVGSFILGFIGALLLNRSFRGRVLARAVVALPWAISPAVAALMFSWIFNQDFGVLNYLLMKLGVISTRIPWLSSTKYALWSVTATTIWKFTPIATFVLLASLQTVSQELYDSAAVDGAGPWHRFWHITVPSVRPVSGILFNLLVLWGFRRFEIIYIMTEGGPAGATETMVIKTYQEAFRFWNMGYASAIGTFTLVVALIFSVIYLRLVMSEE